MLRMVEENAPASGPYTQREEVRVGMAKKKAKAKARPKTKAKAKVAKKTRKVRCAAKTKDGKRCKNSAAGKSKFCGVHKGKK